jgi:AcrR family transcriptional regulator
VVKGHGDNYARRDSTVVTMRKIAAKVGVTPMALYRHFDDREALLAALADDSFTTLAAEWSKVAWNGDPDDDLDTALGDWFSWLCLLLTVLTQVRLPGRSPPPRPRGPQTPASIGSRAPARRHASSAAPRSWSGSSSSVNS